MDTKGIKKLAEQGSYNQALAESNKLLANFPGNKVDILRTRAYVFSLMGDYGNAFQDREQILQTEETEIRDYFLAGDCALSYGHFEKAAIYLNKAILLGQKQNETWFDSAASFLLAYAQFELGDYDSALRNLDHAVFIDAKCAMPLPKLGMCDHLRLKKEIIRRKQEAGKIPRSELES